MEMEKSFKELTPDAILSQILSADKQVANLLSSIGLEPSNYKGKTLRLVCKQRKWSDTEVLQWLKQHHNSGNGTNEERERTKSNSFGKDLAQWSYYMEKTFHRPNLKLLQKISEDFPRVKKFMLISIRG